MPTLKGSQTEKNLLAAFAGESQARNRYTYFASVAKKAGYEQIAAIFLETAENEKEHAEMFFKQLEGDSRSRRPIRRDRRHRGQLEAAAVASSTSGPRYKDFREIAETRGPRRGL